MTPGPYAIFQCTAVIDGREWTARMSLSRDVWDKATEQWRAEYKETCRDRYAAWLRTTAGIELTDEQTADVAVSVLADDQVTGADPPRLSTVTLHGGPLDGETVAVDPTDPEPGIGIIAPGCSYPGGRSWYEPDGDLRWTWTGDIPWQAM